MTIRGLITSLSAGLALAYASNVDGQVVVTKKARPAKTIVIDAGHGMGNRRSGVYDPGAVREGISESDMNLAYAFETGKRLSEKGFNVLHTRLDNSTETPLSQRAYQANNANADLFLSIHMNAVENTGARGPIVYYQNGSTTGSNLAERVSGELNSLTNSIQGYAVNSNPVRSNNYAVLRDSKSPAVLIETGFMSNPSELRILTQNYKQISEGIAKAVDDYLSNEVRR
jgi:N-acetylmuramoyl-L-alanine amidase